VPLPPRIPPQKYLTEKLDAVDKRGDSRSKTLASRNLTSDMKTTLTSEGRTDHTASDQDGNPFMADKFVFKFGFGLIDIERYGDNLPHLDYAVYIVMTAVAIRILFKEPLAPAQWLITGIKRHIKKRSTNNKP
jgi:hypothetical protein